MTENAVAAPDYDDRGSKSQYFKVVMLAWLGRFGSWEIKSVGSPGSQLMALGPD